MLQKWLITMKLIFAANDLNQNTYIFKKNMEISNKYFRSQLITWLHV